MLDVLDSQTTVPHEEPKRSKLPKRRGSLDVAAGCSVAELGDFMRAGLIVGLDLLEPRHWPWIGTRPKTIHGHELGMSRLEIHQENTSRCWYPTSFMYPALILLSSLFTPQSYVSTFSQENWDCWWYIPLHILSIPLHTYTYTYIYI